MSHTLYVIAAYGVSIVTLGALMGWIVLDQQARKQELADLEERGIRRRGDRKDAS